MAKGSKGAASATVGRPTTTVGRPAGGNFTFSAAVGRPGMVRAAGGTKKNPFNARGGATGGSVTAKTGANAATPKGAGRTTRRRG